MAKLTQANEDYLEAIVMLAGEDRSPVRSVDIANRLDVSKPSVNKAVALLREEGFIEQQPYGDVYLTDAGAKYGEAVLERHNTLMRFFVEVLGVEPDVAEDEACCIEHVISDASFRAIKSHMEKWGK